VTDRVHAHAERSAHTGVCSCVVPVPVPVPFGRGFVLSIHWLCRGKKHKHSQIKTVCL
jgi:hypothetical protein